MTNLREDVSAELRILLAEWVALPSNPSATERDYARIKAQIAAACKVLDSLADPK